jgi:excisionase family DNA binding protein
MKHGHPIHGSELRQMLRDGALLTQASVHGRRDMEQPEVLTLVEVARLLRVERHHIAKLIERGLPYHRVGSRSRFLHHEVMAWLQTQKETE